jgi:hypothetical protein
MKAARNEHLEVLQFLRANGCPWDEQACLEAAKNGHLKVLQFLARERLPVGRAGVPRGSGERARRDIEVSSRKRVQIAFYKPVPAAVEREPDGAEAFARERVFIGQ